MLKLTTPSGVFGPFRQIETLSDRYRADGADLPFTVVGQGTISEVQEGDFPPPPAPPVPVPFAVTTRQARIILALQPSPDNAFPHLLAYITAQFEALPEPDKTVAEITWEYSTEVQRTNPLIAQMQAMIGFTDEQIDQLFIQAATL